jgi:predicted RNA methylase
MAHPPPQVLELIQRFDRNREAYRSPHYNETQLRREFLDPLFKCLGWDIDNEQGYAEAYKDVIHEDAIKVGEATKAPDYCFRIGGTRKFFLEAKRPSVDIKNDVSPAYQLRRYAWTTKLPLSILSDFEEFAVYDCRLKPDHKHNAAIGRILYIPYTDYPQRWDEIAGIFSRDAVLKGSFDKFADSNRAKGGTADVDDEFLKTIETWRSDLARNLALRNPKLSQRELNFAVQRIIDRIIFLRIGEGRGIEDYGRLRALTNGDRIYPRLCQLFEQADTRYNSGLFYFKPEKGRHEAPDELTLALDIDDKLLRDIIKGLYYPESPYVFSALPADILGQVYEQFLGKVIRLTEGHRAVVEEKPEVKKAGGVYYTPTYVVDYIVQTTVGQILEGKTPKQAARLKILDLACGSGSFLIGAYEYLLKWHRDFYTRNTPEKWAKGAKPVLVQVGPGNWKLTIAERKRILLDNIFGVDIDTQAVETTKLSLLLKVLEGETQQSLQPVLRLFHERALPDLGDNIKCGNSLIGPDFYQQQMPLLGEEERFRINVFNWWGKDGFPSIKQAGGFDVVIGNPPYGASLTEPETDYLRQAFRTTTKDIDTYTLFIEKAEQLVRPAGHISMIVPTGWYSGPKFSALRRFIACRTDPRVFVNLPYDVFKAWVDTTIFSVVKREEALNWPRRIPHTVSIKTFEKRHRVQDPAEFNEQLQQADFSDWFASGGDEFLTYADSAATNLIRKIIAAGKPLGELSDVQRGVTPFNLTDHPTHATSQPAFAGTVRRYKLDRGLRKYIRFDDTLAEPKPERYFHGPRLLLRELISRQFQLQAVKVTEAFVTNKSMQSILPLPDGPPIDYILGLLNSRLMSWYFLRRSNVGQRDDFPKIVLKETRSLPMRSIKAGDATDKKHQDQIVHLVNEMLTLQHRLSAAKTPQETTALERQIAATDTQLDALVYALYGLTDAEIKIIEASTSSPSGNTE